MFTKKVTDDDKFMSLSASAQALYLHLTMSADDDGFSNQVSVSMFKAHASVSDLQQLLENRFVYQFDDGVIVIRHWRMANALRKDRYTPTIFSKDIKMLGIDNTGTYQMGTGELVANWLPDGCHNISKDKLSKDNLNKDSSKRFSPPTLEEVISYCNERKNRVDAERFCAYYESNGWMVGKNKMKDWKAAVRTWERSDNNGNTTSRTSPAESRWHFESDV